MPIREASICGPHHLLQFPELGEETRKLVVDLRRVLGHYKTSVYADIHQVGHIHFEWKLVSMYHNEFARTACLLHVTSCCSQPHSGSLTLCENR